MEWYFGYRYPHNDLNLEDFRSRENWWKQSSIATAFVKAYPLEEMESRDELLHVKDAWCLAREGKLYLVYLPRASNARLDLTGSGAYQLQWFNPREGGDLQQGSAASLEGGRNRSLGQPPSDPEKDWVAVVTAL